MHARLPPSVLRESLTSARSNECCENNFLSSRLRSSALQWISGNLSTRLIRCTDQADIHERLSAAIALVKTLMPEVEVGILSTAEASFRCHGLEFARARLSAKPGDFRSTPEIVFGTGPSERVLD